MKLAIASLIKQVVRVGAAAPRVFQLEILVKCMYNVLTLLAISIVGGESYISASK